MLLSQGQPVAVHTQVPFEQTSPEQQSLEAVHGALLLVELLVGHAAQASPVQIYPEQQGVVLEHGQFS